MRQVSLVAILTALALGTGGCNLFGGGDTATETPPDSPVAVSPDASPGVVEPLPEASPEATPRTATLPRDLDLIPSTSAEERVQAIQGNRNDPFSIIPTTPSVQISPAPGTEGTTPGGTTPGGTAPGGTTPGGTAPGGRQTPAGQRPGTTGRSPGRTSPTQSPGGLAPIPNLVPRSPTSSPAAAPPPPPPPQPTLARAVEVLGVVQIGGTPYAIINAPNEPSSRYVREGQRLSNGQVAVKRIEVSGPEPVVVFEQYGIEVITAVGGGGAPETTETSPAAVVPTGDTGQAG